MGSKPVLVYGASGYTGRLIVEALRNYQIPFIAAGRSKARIEEAMALVPGIETAEYEVVEVAHDVDSLSELFKRVEVVCNSVGPFEYYGRAVVAACLEAGTHYLDTTGEIPFMDDVANEFHDGFAAKEKVLAPCTAYMYTPLEIAAHVVLETPGIDSLEAMCFASGTPTYGSTQTIFAMFQTSDRAFFLENNERSIWPAARGFEVNIPGIPMSQLAHPWGGGSLPLHFENDPRVRNCRQLTAFSSRPLMEQVVEMHQVYEADIKHLAEEEQQQQLKAIAESIQSGMPPRENPLIHRCTDVVEGRGGNNTSSCVIRSVMPYFTTGVLQAATANYLIGGRQLDAGFVSACGAVGYRELLGQMQDFGLCDVEISA
jgi:hypothetical protein